MGSVQQLFSLEGKTALVTGGTRGIGQAMAVALAEAGADVLLVQVSCVDMVADRIEMLTQNRGMTPTKKRSKRSRSWAGKPKYTQQTSPTTHR